MSGAVFLTVAALICLGVFLNGLRFARMSEERVNRGVQIALPGWLTRGRTFVEHAHLAGRIQMVVAPLFFLFVAAMCFGLLGPVQGMETISLRGAS